MKRIIPLIVLTILSTSLIPQVNATRTGVEVTDAAWGDLSDPIPVYPGDKNIPLLIEIKNIGNQDLGITKATLQFYDPFYFEYYKDSYTTVRKDAQLETMLGELKANKTAVLRYNLNVKDDAMPGTYRLDLRIDYIENLIDTGRFPVYVTIGESSKLLVKDIEITPKNPVAGEPVTINVTLENTGTQVLKDIESHLDLENVKSYGKDEGQPFSPLGSSSSAYIGTLGPGEEKTITMSLISDGSIKPTVYSIRLYLSYRDVDGNMKNDSKTIGIPIHAIGGFEIQGLKIEPERGDVNGVPVILGGGRTTIEFDVINTGTRIANFVMVELGDTNPTIYAEEQKVYIGPIEPDDFSTIRFNIRLGNVSAGRYNIPFKVSYVDSYNQKQVIEKEIPVEVEALDNNLMLDDRQEGKSESAIIRFLKWLFGL